MLEPTPSTRAITIYQGQTYSEDFRLVLDGNPANWAGCTAKWAMKEKITDTEYVLSSLAPLSNVSISLLSDGHIKVVITDENTALVSVKKGVYNLEINWSDGSVWRLFEGAVTVSQEVIK